MTLDGRGVIFGDDAVAYDRARPAYPSIAIEHILSLTDVSSAIEVGAGTGKATAGFARRGIAVTCVEPSPHMANVLRAKDLDGITVEITSFEEYSGPEHPVDLVYAAQAWHWVDRRTAYGHARTMLRSAGILALMWNVPQDQNAGFSDIYEQHAPEILSERDERIASRDSTEWLDEMVSGGFTDVELFEHPWFVQMSGEELCRLRSTYSDHMMLPATRRHRLLEALADSVEEAGGVVEVRYVTRVFSGRN
ncbi:MAG: class I SAM-dependent methyltransferase [Acidimicrobiia bacterium]